MPEANSDMIEGFRDGYDLSLPEPGANRSASYLHGFMCARIDKRVVEWSGTTDDLRAAADQAMEYDAIQQTPGA